MKSTAEYSANSPAFNVSWLRTAVCTVFALCAFASNSIICRLALGAGTIDAASFTAIRLASGALMLLPIATIINSGSRERAFPGSWTSAAMLFVYAAAFSFAYIGLSAGTGALILFGAVQVTMLLAGLVQGERLGQHQWAGLLVALSGLIYLVLPGWQAPPLWAAVLMAAAGAAWGVYSLRGRGATDPIAVTGDNFLRTLPMVALMCLATVRVMDISWRGALLAALSGAITSGLGYVLWYAALRDLSATRAATVQLTVPVLAALGGVGLLSEQITVRLVISSLLIIGGVASTLARFRKTETVGGRTADPELEGERQQPLPVSECLGNEPCNM